MLAVALALSVVISNNVEHEAIRRFSAEAGGEAETTKALPQGTLDSAWKRLEITYDPVGASLLKSAEDGHRIGFLKEHPDLSRIYDLKFLNGVLREKGLAEVK